MDQFSPCEKHFVLIAVRLKANQSHCTSCDLVCVSGDEKGISLRQSSCLLDLVVRTIQNRKNSCSFVGSCLVSIVSRHVRFTTTTKW